MLKKTALYIHIPFCVSKCRYCDFFSQTTISDELINHYIKALCKEINYRKKIHQIISLKTVYIGGGTPSLLSSSHIKKIFDCLKENFPFSSDMEITIEANPDDINEKLLDSYCENGINRLSCGIQSMNDKALQFACRRASVGGNRRLLELLNKNWKKNLSLDLICGLPLESQESFISGLQEIISYKPDHISMYSLTIEEGTPFGKLLESGKLEYDFEFADELWLTGKTLLENNDYKQYEVSNFAKKDKESQHNLFYWNHKDYIGCGSGATGSVYDDNGIGYRWTNTRDINSYIKFWNNLEDCDEVIKNEALPQTSEVISLENSIFEFFMMGLRKVEGVKKSEFENCFHQRIPEKILQNFEEWERKGLCEITKSPHGVIYSMGDKGLLFLNRFLEEII
ncbi:MAG: radical SAM family heme chaperone HemW [Treponema sp.]|nr:radical SAM family heme chaperone HemW [Treponema sp.]